MILRPPKTPASRNRLIERKWRPSLAMIVFAVLTTVVALPLAGLFFFRLYENQLIRQTEAELIHQCAVLAAAVGVTLIVGFLFWRTITRPVRQLIEQMQAIGVAGRDAIRAPAHHGTREFAMLSQGFLDMAERLYDRTDYIATFAAHVSHELKSPLSSIEGAAELLRDAGPDMSERERRKFLDNVIADTQRLTALLDRLRELARADNPQLGGRTTLTPVIAAMRNAFSSLSIEAEGGLDQAIGMSADNATIVFSHLADNATRHHARTLRIRAERAADMIAVEVMNDGERIADNNRDKIFMPFFTTRRESGGTGMGLEIARSMLRAHGGSIELLAADHGVAFLLTFPAA